MQVEEQEHNEQIEPENLKQFVYVHITGKDGHKKFSRQFDVFIEIIVLINVVAVVLESFENIERELVVVFDLIESITIVIFLLEFFTRIWISDLTHPAPTRWKSFTKYLFSFGTFIDIISIIPSIIPFVIPIDLRHLRMLRLVRLFRIFKIEKYLESMRMIGNILKEKRKELLATLLLSFSTLVISSCFVYYLEKDAQPDKFSNILQAFWWGVATLTTIGYGDIYPITPFGKLVGAFVAIMGILIIAIPTGIVSSSFVQKMEEVNVKKRLMQIKKMIKEAFHPRYVPTLGCEVLRSQLSIDAIKLELELAEEEIYKIAEGKNEFRFRNKRVLEDGHLFDKTFLEYRFINTAYGTFTSRPNKIALISIESLHKPSIGYFTYCLAESLKASYMSNEFYEPANEAIDESFGNTGLDKSAVFDFGQHSAYYDTAIMMPKGFVEWKQHLKKLKDKGTNTFILMDTQSLIEYNFELSFFTNSSEAFSLGFEPSIEELKRFGGVNQLLEKHYDPNSIIQFIIETIGADVVSLQIKEELLLNEKLFKTASVLANALKPVLHVKEE